MKRLLLLIFGALFLSLNQPIAGQSSLIFSQQTATWQQIAMLVEQKEYAFAQIQLQTLNQYAHTAEYHYYQTLCILHTQPAEVSLKELQHFLAQFQEIPLKIALLEQALAYFQENKQQKYALFCLEKLAALDTSKRQDYLLQLVQIYYLQKDFREATYYLDQASNTPNVNVSYWRGKIYLAQGNPEKALPQFEITYANNENNLSLFPDLFFLLVFCHYELRQYEELTHFATPFLDKKVADYQALDKIYLCLAESFYQQKKYAEALNFYRQYMSVSAQKITNDLSYKIALCYFESQQYKQAIRFFEPIALQNDSSQGHLANYYLAMAYWYLGQKLSAFFAFEHLYRTENLPTQLQKNVLSILAILANELQLSREAQHYANAWLRKYASQNEDQETQVMQKIMQENSQPLSTNITDTYSYNNTNYYLNEEQKNEQLYRYALELFNQQKYAQVIPLLERLSQTAHTSLTRMVIVQYYLAEAYFQVRQLSKAIGLYQDILQVNTPQSIYTGQTHYSLGYIYFVTQKYSKAMHHWQAFLNFYQQNNYQSVLENSYQDALVRLADCAYMLQRFEEALNLYSQVIVENHPQRNHAILYKALIFKYLKKEKEAREVLDLLTEGNASPQYLVAKKEILQAWDSQQEWQPHLSHTWEKIQEIEPPSELPPNLLAELLPSYQKEHHVEVIRILQDYLENQPNISPNQQSEIYLYIADAYKHLNNDTQAEVYFKKATQNNTQNYASFLANFRLGQIYRQKQEWKLAQNYYQKALNYPNNFKKYFLAQVGFAECLMHEQQFEQAQQLLNTLQTQNFAKENKHNLKTAALCQAKLYFLKSQWQEAEKTLYQKVYDENSANLADETDIEAKYLEAALYQQTQQYDKALKIAEQTLLKISPNNYWENLFLLLMSYCHTQTENKLLAKAILQKIVSQATDKNTLLKAQTQLKQFNTKE
ncbi:MAG: tetratricopeptide repeat protein [Microscillaceae bacterium]|nr:tetratricopeptide repeat protein [Microscillaceae bacterium]MDW8461589.1 CDC27 family protein [Cytophagales bacterium]